MKRERVFLNFVFASGFVFGVGMLFFFTFYASPPIDIHWWEWILVGVYYFFGIGICLSTISCLYWVNRKVKR